MSTRYRVRREHVIGAKIARFVQVFSTNNNGAKYLDLREIHLDNGNVIRFVVVEEDGAYGIRAVLANKGPKSSAPAAPRE